MHVFPFWRLHSEEGMFPFATSWMNAWTVRQVLYGLPESTSGPEQRTLETVPESSTLEIKNTMRVHYWCKLMFKGNVCDCCMWPCHQPITETTISLRGLIEYLLLKRVWQILRPPWKGWNCQEEGWGDIAMVTIKWPVILLDILEITEMSCWTNKWNKDNCVVFLSQ